MHTMTPNGWPDLRGVSHGATQATERHSVPLVAAVHAIDTAFMSLSTDVDVPM